MINSVLKRLRESGGFLAQYNAGMSSLWTSGVFDFLREKARPRVSKGESNTNAAALECARSSGYFECLEDLIRFRELYLDIPEVREVITPDYGAVDTALRRGDLLEEEANAIRSGKPVEYTTTVS